MRSGDLYSFLLLLSLTLYSVHLYQVQSLRLSSFPAEPFSPFSIALKTLQSDINYTFENVQLLGRAMTHASYSEENNRALSILGSGVIESSMVLQLVDKNLDISGKDLNHRISEFSKEASCAADGMRLRLEKVIRVSSKTNSSAPGVVCGAYRAFFGAVTLDSESLDTAGGVFLGIWEDRVGKAMAM
ncbi:hypothetical protein ACH5RR_025614 [Cinchona calisaya]|uniref:RNase III domain-containing protein n=1 Tax=Cinchona calisaya TaxID=153742 RepID=A0ABD2Z453_9GENT